MSVYEMIAMMTLGFLLAYAVQAVVAWFRFMETTADRETES